MLKFLKFSGRFPKAVGNSCRYILLVFILLNSTLCFAQKYTFTHYDIEDGLIESQVSNFCLDNEHRLWMATFGGACRFDGKEFISYTRQNGMPSNFVYNVFVDKNDIVWFGTDNGLVKLINKKLFNFALPKNIRNGKTRNIIQDGSGTVWALINNRLFKVTGNTIQQQIIQDTMNQPVTCLAVDKSGRLYTAVYNKGLYRLEKDTWRNIAPFPSGGKDLVITMIAFDRKDDQKIYLKDYNGIYTINDNKLVPYENGLFSTLKTTIFSMALDADNNLWIGTSSGAYYLKNHQLTRFTTYNGLTDNTVSDIYNDADNNLWFATLGNGFYKYDGDHYIMLDRSQGLPYNEVIMGIAKDRKGNILLGIDGGGMMRYNEGKLFPITVPGKPYALKKPQCIFRAKDGMLWIGDSEGVWNYDGSTFKLVKSTFPFAVTSLSQDDNGTIWITNGSGCYYFENNDLKRLNDLQQFPTATTTPMGRDSVFIGTSDGVALAVDKKVVKSFKIKETNTSTVFCLLRYKNMLMVGTDDRGIFIWNRSTGKVSNYSVRDGLNANTIYSLATDDNNVIWVGTGRGVNRLIFDSKKNDFTVTGNGGPKSPILESNQNAVMYDNHKVWIGTTKGVVIYNVNTAQLHTAAPHIIIQSAKLISGVTEGSIWAKSTTLNNGAKLSYSQNHLEISYLGIHLRDPNGIMYRYKLKGLDSSYSQLVKTNTVSYPSLPPGSYTFEVKAFSADGKASENKASFSFSIVPPFYQTVPFRIAGITFFILLGIILQSYRHRVRVNRQKIIEATKREERLKIRQQTAEDFHDELGNKLTRITVLSEILDTKMDPAKADQKKLLEQIKQNASSLYNGTKDILWALDPKSNNLYEILNHIKDFGNELFLDTPVEFEFNGIDESLNRVKLPMEYSRNIPMIFKELLNNILKHANATNATLNLDKIQKNEMHFTLMDNGKGFECSEAGKGQGINNIKTRIKRLGGDIHFKSEKGVGTLIDLRIGINNTVLL